MDKVELRKLFMNMYSGNTNAWGAATDAAGGGFLTVTGWAK